MELGISRPSPRRFVQLSTTRSSTTWASFKLIQKQNLNKDKTWHDMTWPQRLELLWRWLTDPSNHLTFIFIFILNSQSPLKCLTDRPTYLPTYQSAYPTQLSTSLQTHHYSRSIAVLLDWQVTSHWTYPNTIISIMTPITITSSPPPPPLLVERNTVQDNLLFRTREAINLVVPICWRGMLRGEYVWG